MLKSLVIEVKGKFDREIFYGYQVYSWFLRCLEKVDPKKSAQYHQKNTQKPFTISNIYQHQNRNFIRFTFLTNDIFNLFFTAIFLVKHLILKDKKYPIINVFITHQKDLPLIINKMIDAFNPQNQPRKRNKLKLTFLSPTVFKQGNDFLLLPEKEAIINSFLEKQKSVYQKIIFSPVDFQIIKHKIKTTIIKVDPFAVYRGIVGQIEVKSKENLLPFFHPLSFFGLGMKTTMGLGQIVLI